MSAKQPSSPCVSICALDENDICIGCLRSGDEVSRWGRMTAQEKTAVLRKVAEREEAAGFLSCQEASKAC